MKSITATCDAPLTVRAPSRRPINLPGFASAPYQSNDPKLAARRTAARTLKSGEVLGYYYPAHFPPKSSNTVAGYNIWE